MNKRANLYPLFSPIPAVYGAAPRQRSICLDATTFSGQNVFCRIVNSILAAAQIGFFRTLEPMGAVVIGFFRTLAATLAAVQDVPQSLLLVVGRSLGGEAAEIRCMPIHRNRSQLKEMVRSWQVRLFLLRQSTWQEIVFVS